MPFMIIRNDITKVEADAIVNTANPMPVIGSGTDSAIYEAAGKEQLLAERKKIGQMKRGEAKETPAFNLNAKYIIHTIGPAWTGGLNGEADILHQCYKNSLNLAKSLNCSSIAFPLLATGAYSFPKDEALKIAISEFSDFLMKNDMRILLVVLDKDSFKLSQKLQDDIDEYIDEHNACSTLNGEYENGVRPRPPVSIISNLSGVSSMAVMSDAIPDFFKAKGDTFQERLFKLIDEKGMTDVQVYSKADIDRKLFSKIRSNKDYKPKKNTVLLLCLAMELDMNETSDLLRRAGYALTDGSISDRIISYCIQNNNYNIGEIDAYLLQYNQETLWKYE